MRNILFLIIICSMSITAQITISSSDISNIFAVGTSATINEYDAAVVNIGSTGGGNNWDFSGFLTSSTFNLLSVNPSSTPHTGEFPGAEFAVYSMGDFNGEAGEIWTYFDLSANFGHMGTSAILASQPSDVFAIKNDPFGIELQLPATYNSSWSQTYTQTIYLNGTPFSSNSVSSTALIDAYGSMTLPGGANFEALRIRESITVMGVTSTTYTFMSENGAMVTLEATDPNPPTSGNINVEWYDWNLAYTTSSVDQINDLPMDFTLKQNYPNPFNPSTNIEYSLREASFVELKVFDILGNEVALLVSEEQSAGTYRAHFTADNLSSGFYVAQLRTGNSVKTIKMSLLK